METSAKITRPKELVVGSAATSTSGDPDDKRPYYEAELAARYRLIIEASSLTGGYVYKTVNNATGEVVRQYPREEVLRMSETGDYSAGTMIDTSA